MINRKLFVRAGALGIAVTAALAPVVPAWAGSHKSHHKAKSTVTGIAECPSAASLSAAAGTTYTGPTTEQAAEKGWVVCDYSAQGEVALLVSLYTKGFPLREVSANSAGPTTKISGIGNGASYSNTDVFVQRNSAPSFSVIDQTADLTLAQTKAMAKAIAG